MYLFWTLRLCFPNPPHPLNLKDLYRWWFESKCSGGKMRPVGRTWSEVVADKRFRRPWWSRSGYLCCFPLNLLRVREIFTFDLIDIYSQKVDQVFYDSLYHRKWGKRARAKSLQAPTKYLVNSNFSSNLSDSSELSFMKLSLLDQEILQKYF